jgi:Fe-S cluster biogenesis protein NfuA
MRSIRRTGRAHPTVEARVAAILVEVEPLLRIDHCRLKLVEFSRESGILTLAIDGGCPDCDVSPATFSTAIAAHVKMRVPEVREIRIA